MGELWRRLLFLFRRGQFERELDDEMLFHVEMRSQRDGDSYQARRVFGNVGILKEVSREMWGWSSLERLWQDVRYALRQLGRNPGFASVAVLSLGLGIGANTAIFGLIDHVMLRFLPVRDPSELVVVRGDFSYRRFEQFRDRNEIFSGVFGTHPLGNVSVTIPGAPAAQAEGELVTGTYFPTLGVGAALGRTILPDDDRAPESSPVAVISYAYWKRAFGGSPDVLGKKIQVRSSSGNAGTGGLDIYEGATRSTDGAVLTIVGVAPPEFFGDTVGFPKDLWIPMMMQPAVMPGRPWLNKPNVGLVSGLMGRLKPGISEAQARASFTVLWRQVMTEEAGSQITEQRKREIVKSTPPVESGEKGFARMRRQFSQPLLVLMTVVGLVLLIACLNVANLLLARATARRREIGVRLSLGAGRVRLIRQLLTESLVLASLGGALGVLIAYFGTNVLLALVSSGESHIVVPFQTDFRTLGFTAAMSFVTGLLFGLAPALRATRITLAETLKARGAAGGRGVGAAKLLVAAQVAVSMVLLIGAGLFLRTLYNLKTQDVGYNPDRLLMMRVDPISAGYHGDDIGRVCKNLLDRIAALPGVRAATFSETDFFPAPNREQA